MGPLEMRPSPPLSPMTITRPAGIFMSATTAAVLLPLSGFHAGRERGGSVEHTGSGPSG